MAIKDLIRRYLDMDSKAAVALPVQTSTVGGKVQRPNLTNYKALINEGLYKNAAVQGCISALQSTMNEAPVIVVDANGEPVPNHPLARVFQRPNAAMSQATFWKFVTTYLHTGGNCYIHKLRNELGMVIGLVPYHDGQFTPVAGDYDFISHYVYQVDGKAQNIPVRDVIQLRWGVDPLNPVKGLSPIDLVATKIQTENELDATIYSQMVNGGIPTGILTVPPATSEAAKNQLREQWQEKGASKKRTVAVVTSDVSYEQMAQSLAELQVEGIYGQLEASICGVFRVHPVVAMTYAGLMNSTYSNMETAFKEFTTLTRVPLWNDWEEQISVGLATELNGGYRLEFDLSHVAALSNDAEIQQNTLSQFAANIITQNEARVLLGYPEVPDGDKFAYALAPAPVGFLDGENVTEPTEGETDLFSRKDGRVTLNEEKAKAVWKEVDDTNEKHGEDYLPYVRDLIDDVTKAAIGTSKAAKALDPNNINVKALVEKFMKASQAERSKMVKEIVELAMKDVTGADLNQVFSFIDEIEERVNQQVNDKMTQATETMKERVKQIVKDNAGKPTSEVAAALRKGMDESYKGQADVIAKTTARAQTTETQVSTWSGVNKRETDPNKKLVKVWITRRDSKVRASHEAMDGKVVEVDEAFTFPDGDKAPGPAQAEKAGNAVNCRCVITTVRRGSLG
jgi:HK97 family phage portal protein